MPGLTLFLRRSVLAALSICALAGSAKAQDRYSVLASSNLLLGPGDIPQAELLPGMTVQALVPDPSGQDLWALGPMFTGMPGVTPLLGAVRYGRTNGRSEARILVGPSDLGITMPSNASFTLRGGVTSSSQGPVLAVSTGLDAKIYLYNARTLAPYLVAGSNSIDLLQAGQPSTITKVQAIAGLPNKLYVADSTQPLISVVDLPAGTQKLCKLDSIPAALRVTQGQMQALTDKGTAQLATDCSSTTAAATPPKPDPGTPTTINLPARNFEISERLVEPVFQAGMAGVRSRRAVFVYLLGSNPVTVTINAGTCTAARTQFLVGADPFANPVTATQINLTSAQNRAVLHVDQATPGEDCVAVLSSGEGEALLRIRGAVEGQGASAVLLDRSYSMERPLLGVGASSAPTLDQQRITALRQALVSLVGSLSLGSATGPWVFLPFTDDAPSAWATPATGFTSMPALANPDNPSGLRIKDFGGSGSDKLDLGGPSDIGQSLITASARLLAADMLPIDPMGTARRLWMIADGVGGKKGILAYQRALPAMLKSRAQFRFFGAGGLMLDPLIQQFQAHTTGFGGDRLFGPPRGAIVEAHSHAVLQEGVVSAMVRDVLRGRPLGSFNRGEIGMGAKALTASYSLRRIAGKEDPWAILLIAYEHADATVTVKIDRSGVNLIPRCIKSTNTLICATPGFDGDYNITVTGQRPNGLSTFGVVRPFVSSAGPAGEIGFFPAFTRAMWKSGDRVRVQVRLSERGLPLRGATVTAKVNGPNGPLGTVVAQARVADTDLSALLSGNGDLTPGQAKVELIDPLALPAQKLIANAAFSDQAVTGDGEPEDGLYTTEFLTFVPGLYTVDITANYSGIYGQTGIIQDRIATNVIVGIDQKLTAATVRSERLSAGGIRLRFTPQDSGKNLLGPGQGTIFSFAQGGKAATSSVGDYLDGSYRADVSGVNPDAPFDLISPSGKIEIYNPANPNPGDTGGTQGCALASERAPSTTGPAAALALLGLYALARTLRRRSAA